VKSLTALASREGPEIVAKVKSLADKAGGLAEDGRGLVSEIRGVLGREKNKIGKLLDTVISVGAQAKEVIRTVHAMVTRIARGEGSIGALLKDDEIYDNLREMMRDLKQHPWKVLWKD
jgi:phospholipid/cholesterol/gamma-HCH transport system substrate-binding protein